MFDRLLRACSDHGLEVGSYDREVLRWIAGQKPETAQVIIGLVHRAADTERRAGDTAPPATPFPV
jgi:hypothetical protein